MAVNRIVVSVSGGMDSATALGVAIDAPKGLNEILKIYVYSFVYGSKHNPFEIAAAKKIIEFYQKKLKTNVRLFHKIIDVSDVFAAASSDSALMNHGMEVPEGHYEAENMRQTVVPGRNLIFLSMLASIAETLEAKTVYCGVHAGDHHIYPDCRPQFIAALNNTLQAGTEGKVTIECPFLGKDKRDILLIGKKLSIPVPYHLTRTCYKPTEVACGKCASCQERLYAFHTINEPDPVEYECRDLVNIDGSIRRAGD